MALEGNTMGLLHGKHAAGCDGTEYSACRPVVVPPVGRPSRHEAKIKVVFMTWCSECEAADYDIV